MSRLMLQGGRTNAAGATGAVVVALVEFVVLASAAPVGVIAAVFVVAAFLSDEHDAMTRLVHAMAAIERAIPIFCTASNLATNGLFKYLR